jgi:hypothetical protein
MPSAAIIKKFTEAPRLPSPSQRRRSLRPV